jgi:hypothetical protein
MGMSSKNLKKVHKIFQPVILLAILSACCSANVYNTFAGTGHFSERAHRPYKGRISGKSIDKEEKLLYSAAKSGNAGVSGRSIRRLR